MNDLTGRRFGSLLALREQRIPGSHNVHWLCRCDCGIEKQIARTSLLSGSTSSCGCERQQRRSEKITVHGKSNTPEHITWMNIHLRCSNPKSRSYPQYGGNGIKVCDRWIDFEAFLEDMGEKPSPSHSLDRIDGTLGYSKENCRWATSAEQIRNRKVTKFITIDGITLCQSDWCKKLGIEYSNCYRTAKKQFGGSVEAVIRHRYLEGVATGVGESEDQAPAA